MLSRVTIFAVGKLKGWQREGCDDYLKRLKKYFPVEEIEVAESDMNRLTKDQVLEQEAERIERRLPNGAQHVIVLDREKGKEYRSEELSRERLALLGAAGRSHVAFVIGGALGLDSDLIQRSDESWSFGEITYPHGLARVVLLEQLYRAVKIHRGEKYHW